MAEKKFNAQKLKAIFSEIQRKETSFAGRFYSKLFELCPEVEDLFKSVGMEMQGRMLVQAIGLGIKNIENPGDLKIIYSSLGKRHINYGVRSEYYPFIITAVVETCKSMFGRKFDEQTEQDLQSLLEMVVSFMLEGAKKPDPKKASGRSYHASMKRLDDPYLAKFLRINDTRKPATALPEVADLASKIRIDYMGEKAVEASPMLTLLEISQANGIPHICECGGRARCSTCRVMIIDGEENCLPRNTLEENFAKQKGFGPEIRLACQTRAVGDMTLKRLVKDEVDIEMAVAGTVGDIGQEIEAAVLFTDIWDFTAFAETHLPYDVIHALNHLFRELGQAVDDNDGFVDKYIGDNLMAIFGLGQEGADLACRNAVQAAFDMLENLHTVNAYLAKYLGNEFRLGVGVAFGPMVTGEVGFSLKKQFTAIGDTVNVAARLQSETRKQQVDLLVSDSVLSHLMADFYEVGSSYEFELKGKSTKVVAHEVRPHS
ncbi:adenylate/guanylate cyclase domain-containing protein [Ruegeria arenilitoris]|uniref:adenylate/guanylate cyclase domain-containing protein n=1 Tax=Ruegeria arenilitoris TaxID=1173585 RepID=UPI00147D14E3|nr:adenylate/guanylate cyclase domain-containing protein [Ruegeria arenilitoris]